MHDRENALKEWLVDTLNQKDFILKPLAGDASFRRYFRISYNELSQVVMDAPPEKEDLEPFIRIANTFKNAGVPTPEILAFDIQQGFLLLSDFGDQLLLGKLQAETVDGCYQQAMTTLLKIQNCSLTDEKLPAFDQAFMLKEMNLCPEWFFQAYLSLELTLAEQQIVHHSLEWIATVVAQQPLTYIHRDYHSRNLMILADGELGVIDFQDAMRGPITYDLVSLLKDCYISWPREQILKWVSQFHSQSAVASIYTLADFIRAFDLCGLQRHIKVLGVFSRLYLRDNKAGYLQDLPLTLRYVLETTERYEELHPLFHLLQSKVRLP